MKEEPIDYNLVNKEYKKLKCPKWTYNPTKIPFNNCKWTVLLSDRSRGKTTNLLLYGMILNKLYGIEIQYIRTLRDMIAPKNALDLFRVINEFEYVKKITDGAWDFVTYEKRRWYYAKTENNELVKSDTPVCVMLSIDQSEIYKSAYNAPYGDYVIYDECIDKYYSPNQFIYFLDLLKTIFRDRTRPVVVLSANTIDRNSPFFNELEIADTVGELSPGDNIIVNTELGTKIYIEIIDAINSKQKNVRDTVNRMFYGFSNTRLASITGADTWAVKTYPHPPAEYNILLNRHYIFFNNKLLQIEICENNDGVVFCFVHPGKQIHDDSIVYSLYPNLNYRYGLGSSRMDKYIWDMYKNGKFTYCYNDIGDLVDKYVYMVKKSGGL